MNQPIFENLTLNNDGPVWTLVINRPKAMNALNSMLLKELEMALDYLAKRSYSECRVLIVTGSGEKAFVAGADIKELSTLDANTGKLFAKTGQDIFRKFEKLQIPVIAAVNGFCLGGGLELALACDFIFASENAKMGLPEVTLGLIPGFGGTVRLARRVGMAKAKEMVFTGDFISSQEALLVKLVNKVLPQAELLPAAIKTAQTISQRGSLAVKSAKISIMAAYDQTLDEGMNTEAQGFSELFASQDFKEGTTAFVEKRTPSFKGQ